MQGVAHGYLALMWDKAVILDERANVDTLVTPTYSPYPEVMAAAIAMIKAAIAIADTSTFTLPIDGWIPGLAYTSKDLARLGHTFIARFETYVARSATERAAVNWADVIAQVDAGITADFAPIGSPTGLSDTYKQVAARVRAVPATTCAVATGSSGQSDSTEGWKNWVATPVANRVAFHDAHAGSAHHRRGRSDDCRRLLQLQPNIAFFNPTRGTYLQTFYYYTRYGAGTTYNNGPLVAIGRTEMDMLKAEALVRLNRASEAIPLINKTRVANGKLPAIDINGPPDVAGCVPRKTTGACGGLWDALRYEKRIEGAGVDGQVAYWDARGWNTLAKNSFIQFPIAGARARDSAAADLHVRRRRSPEALPIQHGTSAPRA